MAIRPTRSLVAACLVATAAFALFTYWQFNDLNQYGTELWQGWVVFYAATAAVSLLTVFRPLPPGVYLVAAAAVLCAAIWRSLDIEWENTVLYNETNPAGNESGGLLIVALWLGFLGWRLRRRGAAAVA